jgi:TPR repeat protein
MLKLLFISIVILAPLSAAPTKKAPSALEVAAMKGDCDAVARVAIAHHPTNPIPNTKQVTESESWAKKWYRIGAEKGCIASQLALATLLYSPSPVAAPSKNRDQDMKDSLVLSFLAEDETQPLMDEWSKAGSPPDDIQGKQAFGDYYESQRLICFIKQQITDTATLDECLRLAHEAIQKRSK